MAGQRGERPARLCRTAAECFQAGWDDGVNDEPTTQAERDRLVQLLGTSMRQRKAG